MNYIARRLSEENIGDDVELLQREILTPETLERFDRLYQEISGKEPFVDEEERDVDLINVLNYALFRRRRDSKVAEAGARDVLVHRFRTNPPAS